MVTGRPFRVNRLRVSGRRTTLMKLLATPAQERRVKIITTPMYACQEDFSDRSAKGYCLCGEGGSFFVGHLQHQLRFSWLCEGCHRAQYRRPGYICKVNWVMQRTHCTFLQKIIKCRMGNMLKILRMLL